MLDTKQTLCLNQQLLEFKTTLVTVQSFLYVTTSLNSIYDKCFSPQKTCTKGSGPIACTVCTSRNDFPTYKKEPAVWSVPNYISARFSYPYVNITQTPGFIMNRPSDFNIQLFKFNS